MHSRVTFWGFAGFSGRWATGAACAVALGVLTVCSARAQETRLAALKAEAKAKPRDADAAFALGRAYRRAGHWAEAKTELARAAALASGDAQARARYELVVVEWDQGITNNALPSPPSLPKCRGVKGGKYGDALSSVCAAEAWLTMERWPYAADELAAATKIDPNLYELKLAEAKVNIYKDAHDDAVTKLKALTVAHPTRAEGWYWLGRELFALSKRAEAVEPLRKAKAIDADWPEVRFWLARALPDGIEARDEARVAVAMRTNWAAAHARLGELETATGGWEAAKTEFELAIKQSPTKYAPWYAGAAIADLKLKKPEEAKKMAQEAVKVSGTDPLARLALAESQAALNDTDAAVETFKLAYGLDNKDATGLVRAAEVLLAAKEPVKAEAHAETAARTFPDDGRAWTIRGDALLATGDRKGAKDAYKRALACKDGGIDKASVTRKIDAIK